MSGKKGVEINMLANDKDFQRGVKNVEEGLEQVADALDDVAKDADKAGRKLGDEISDGAKDAERSVEKLERGFKEVADASKRETAKAGDALKRNTKEATTQASRDLEELKDEALQNASETFSSFDGSVESFVDGIQGTFGGIVSNIGPVGAAAGAAAAIGLGVITSELQAASEKAEELRQQTNELALEIIEAGGNLEAVAMADRLRDWALAVRDNKEWWEIWQESTVSNLQAVENATRYSKRGAQELFDAMSGRDPAAALETLTEVEDRLSTVQGELEGLSRSETGWREREQALTEEYNALSDVSAAIREKQGFQEESLETARKLIDYTEEQARKDEAAAAAADQRADAVSSLQDELDDAVESWGDYYDAETGATDPAAYLAAMQARMDATRNFNTNVQSLADQFGLTADEVQAILDQGVDFAPMLQSIIDSGMGDQYATQIRAMLDGGQAILDGTPTTATITTHADIDDARIVLDNTAEERTAPIEADADTTTAGKALDQVAAKARTAKITATVDLAAATASLTNFINRKRTAVVTVEARDREGKLVP